MKYMYMLDDKLDKNIYEQQFHYSSKEIHMNRFL